MCASNEWEERLDIQLVLRVRKTHCYIIYEEIFPLIFFIELYGNCGKCNSSTFLINDCQRQVANIKINVLKRSLKTFKQQQQNTGLLQQPDKLQINNIMPSVESFISILVFSLSLHFSQRTVFNKIHVVNNFNLKPNL